MPNTTVRFELDVSAFEKFAAEYPKKATTAYRDALNRTMQHGRTVAGTDLARVMDARKGSVMRRLIVNKATLTRQYVTLRVKGGVGLSVANLGARQTKAGVTYSLFGTRTLIPRGFIFLGLSGNRLAGVDARGAKRVMTKGKYAGRLIKRGPRAGQPLLREPIVSQYGPAVSDVWSKTSWVKAHTMESIETDLPKNVNSQIQRFSR